MVEVVLVYSTLLSSYTKSDKHLGKAKETFEKMRELGFLMKPSPFNSTLSFHTQENMVEELLREMEENNVAPDSLMVNKVLRIYAAESNVEAMETFMKMWSGEEGIKLKKETMVAVAKAYAKAGSTKKAIEMYGGCKKNEKLENDGYKTVIGSLLKLDDVEGAEKVYGEKRIESWGVDKFDWKEEKWDALKDGDGFYSQETFGEVVEKVSSKLAGWKRRFLSLAGRITLTKSTQVLSYYKLYYADY
ncbi:hypothetical protein Bca52824_064087 [Brassica carinata]|uniref:Pentatricopeptide repeat-containing protein n=1 Tax=Brassica carinata TaxID=52824 RepID=A0A8X7QHM9_BRACI|nr:hypothetical protein Bca52824_064087 [Brassica carinata]